MDNLFPMLEITRFDSIWSFSFVEAVLFVSEIYYIVHNFREQCDYRAHAQLPQKVNAALILRCSADEKPGTTKFCVENVPR